MSHKGLAETTDERPKGRSEGDRSALPAKFRTHGQHKDPKAAPTPHREEGQDTCGRRDDPAIVHARAGGLLSHARKPSQRPSHHEGAGPDEMWSSAPLSAVLPRRPRRTSFSTGARSATKPSRSQRASPQREECMVLGMPMQTADTIGP